MRFNLDESRVMFEDENADSDSSDQAEDVIYLTLS